MKLKNISPIQSGLRFFRTAKTPPTSTRLLFIIFFLAIIITIIQLHSVFNSSSSAFAFFRNVENAMIPFLPPGTLSYQFVHFDELFAGGQTTYPTTSCRNEQEDQHHLQKHFTVHHRHHHRHGGNFVTNVSLSRSSPPSLSLPSSDFYANIPTVGEALKDSLRISKSLSSSSSSASSLQQQHSFLRPPSSAYTYPFDSIESWTNWCAGTTSTAPHRAPLATPMHQCYKPECFFPLTVKNRENNNNTSSSNPLNNKNFDSSVYDFELDASRIGKGCIPNPFYVPPNSMMKRREPKQYKISNDDENQNKGDELLVKNWRRGHQVDEFQCKARKSERSRLLEGATHHQEENAENNDRPHVGALQKFKKRTSWMFSKWYDWNGKCEKKKQKSTGKEEEFQLSGSHSKKDGLYRLKNVCFRPNGGLVGYLGGQRRKFSDVLDPYYGTDDVGWITHSLQMNLVDFIQNENNHKRLKKPADCYLDTKVILFPLDWRTDNPGHCFYRTGFTLRCIESAFGRDAMWSKENVTVAYVRVAPADRPFLHTKEWLMKKNMMKYYYDILGTSWFSINGVPPNRSAMSREEKIRVEREMYDGYSPTAEEEEQQHEPMACFKEVVIAQNALLSTDSSSHQKVFGFPEDKARAASQPSRSPMSSRTDVPGAQTSFQIFGVRTLRDRQTLAILDKKLRSCSQLPPRRKLARHAMPFDSPERKKVHVLFAVRSLFRRISLQPYLIPFLAARVRAEFGPDAIFEVIEHARLTFREIIERYSRADILIGNYGAALMWSLFMPPQAMIVEFSTYRLGAVTQSGIGKNLQTDYGGAMIVQDQHHIVLFDKESAFARWPLGMNFTINHRMPESIPALERLDSVLSLRALDFVMKKLGCISKNIPFVLPPSSSLPSLDHNDENDHSDEVSEFVAPLPTCCDFSSADIESAIIHTDGFRNSKVWDQQSVPMLLNLRLFESSLSPSSSSSFFFSPRLHALLHNPRMLSTFSDVTKIFALPTSSRGVEPERDVKIVFVEPCCMRPSLLAELSALHQVFERVEQVFVAEYAMGRDFCLHHHRNTNLFVDGERLEENCAARTERAFSSFHEVIASPDEVNMTKFNSERFVRCDYPCLEHGPFDLVLHDCISDNCQVDLLSDKRQKNTKMHQKPSTGDEDYNSYHYPSATDVFTKMTNGLFGVILSFEFSIPSSATIPKSAAILNLLDPQLFVVPRSIFDGHDHNKKEDDFPKNLFAFRGPVIGRMRIVPPSMTTTETTYVPNDWIPSSPFYSKPGFSSSSSSLIRSSSSVSSSSSSLTIIRRFRLSSETRYPYCTSSKNKQNKLRSNSDLVDSGDGDGICGIKLKSHDRLPPIRAIFDDQIFREAKKTLESVGRSSLPPLQPSSSLSKDSKLTALSFLLSFGTVEKLQSAREPRFHGMYNMTRIRQINTLYTSASLAAHNIDEIPLAVGDNDKNKGVAIHRLIYGRDHMEIIHNYHHHQDRKEQQEQQEEFGFNLMVQQAIRSEIPFNPERVVDERDYYSNFVG